MNILLTEEELKQVYEQYAGLGDEAVAEGLVELGARAQRKKIVEYWRATKVKEGDNYISVIGRSAEEVMREIEKEVGIDTQ